jgi:hypothetical protein
MAVVVRGNLRANDVAGVIVKEPVADSVADGVPGRDFIIFQYVLLST